jgi:thioredoxin 1
MYVEDGVRMGKPIVYDFYATWCAPCRMQEPILREVAKKFGDKIEVKKIDVDREPALTSRYAIRAVPTLIVEKDGEVIHRYVGVTRRSVLEEDLNSLLENERPS